MGIRTKVNKVFTMLLVFVMVFTTMPTDVVAESVSGPTVEEKYTGSTVSIENYNQANDTMEIVADDEVIGHINNVSTTSSQGTLTFTGITECRQHGRKTNQQITVSWTWNVDSTGGTRKYDSTVIMTATEQEPGEPPHTLTSKTGQGSAQGSPGGASCSTDISYTNLASSSTYYAPEVSAQNITKYVGDTYDAYEGVTATCQNHPGNLTNGLSGNGGVIVLNSNVPTDLNRYSTPGSYTQEFQATDHEGDSSKTSRTVTVHDKKAIVTYPEFGRDGNNDNVPDNLTAELQSGKRIKVALNGGTWTTTSAIGDLSAGTYTADQTFAIVDNVTLQPTPTKAGYVFAGWSKAAGTAPTTWVFTAQWESDTQGNAANPNTQGDGIPDKYQKKVVFQIENGKWSDGTSADKIKYVTLSNASGKWDANGSASLTAPTGMTANLGYKNGQWDQTPPAHVSGTSTLTYKYRYSIDNKSVTYPEAGTDANNDNVPDSATVSVQSGNNIEMVLNGGTWQITSAIGNLMPGTYTADQTITISDTVILQPNPTRTGYVFTGWSKTAGTAPTTWALTAQWESDTRGNAANPETKGDGIPDKYQKKVVFQIENGKWSDGTSADKIQYVTLTNASGKWDVNGSASLTAPTGMATDLGYKDGRWSPAIPTHVSGTSTVTYKYSHVIDNKTVTYPEAGVDANNDNVPDAASATVQKGKKIDIVLDGGTWTTISAIGDLAVGTHDTDQTITISDDITIMPDPVKTGFTFVGWEKTAGTNPTTWVFTAKWEGDTKGDAVDPDNKGDGIPDKFQKRVLFQIENGRWSDNTDADILSYATLADANGKWDENGIASITVPVNMTANYGYKDGRWDVIPSATLSDTTDVAYKYSYAIDYKIVAYPEAGKDASNDKTPDKATAEVQKGKQIKIVLDGGTWKTNSLIGDLGPGTYTSDRLITISDDVAIMPNPVKTGFLFVGWEKTAGTDSTTWVFTAKWEKFDIVDTGDSRPVVIWLSCMLLACAGIFFIKARKPQ